MIDKEKIRKELKNKVVEDVILGDFFIKIYFKDGYVFEILANDLDYELYKNDYPKGNKQ